MGESVSAGRVLAVLEPVTLHRRDCVERRE